MSGAGPDAVRAALADVWRPGRDPAEPLAAWGARDVLLDVLGALVRLVRPAVVVETGVALGYSSATILAALEANGHGRLHSIDLPAPQWDPDREVGELVPAGLRSRWALELGPSQRLLPRALDRLAPVDLFLHDSNHGYSAQLREYRTAWPALRPGGILVSDDVWSPAFLEHAAAVGARPLLVAKPVRGAIGLARKP
ncbi:MAG: class I SAM-dependent methyltransferase [Thermoleophilia bacterium]